VSSGSASPPPTSEAEGDAAIEQLLNAYERALRKEPRADHRRRIEHFSLPTVRHIERAAELGITASMQPNFAVHPPLDDRGQRTGRGLQELIGAKRFARRHPYRRLLEAGILVNAARAAFEAADKGTLIQSTSRWSEGVSHNNAAPQDD
jgi:predicted amidohydrolase YtcJ